MDRPRVPEPQNLATARAAEPASRTWTLPKAEATWQETCEPERFPCRLLQVCGSSDSALFTCWVKVPHLDSDHPGTRPLAGSTLETEVCLPRIHALQPATA